MWSVSVAWLGRSRGVKVKDVKSSSLRGTVRKDGSPRPGGRQAGGGAVNGPESCPLR